MKTDIFDEIMFIYKRCVITSEPRRNLTKKHPHAVKCKALWSWNIKFLLLISAQHLLIASATPGWMFSQFLCVSDYSQLWKLHRAKTLYLGCSNFRVDSQIPLFWLVTCTCILHLHLTLTATVNITTNMLQPPQKHFFPSMHFFQNPDRKDMLCSMLQ